MAILEGIVGAQPDQGVRYIQKPFSKTLETYKSRIITSYNMSFNHWQLEYLE